MDKFDKLVADMKAVADTLAQAQRSLAELRHEYNNLKKLSEINEKLAADIKQLQDKLAKISSFVSGA